MLALLFICLDHRVLDSSVLSCLQILLEHGYHVKGPVPLPSKRKLWSILSAPFVFKNSRDQIHIIRHKRLLQVYPKGHEARSIPELMQLMDLPSTVTVKIK